MNSSYEIYKSDIIPKEDKARYDGYVRGMHDVITEFMNDKSIFGLTNRMKQLERNNEE
jgi:hypothetical protein